MLTLTTDVLHRLWPHALPGMVEGVATASAETLQRFGIVTLRDLIDFIAECSEETGGMTRVVESGAYTAARAHEVWPRLFPTVADAVPFVMNERLLFNKTYGGRLGNHLPDDGYNFRGRGMIQLTGRDWYTKIGAVTQIGSDGRMVTGLDLVNNPDLVAHPVHTLACAAAFWKLAGVSKLANVGNFEGEVRRINGGLTNMAARLAWRATCMKILTPQAVMATTQGAKPVTDTSAIPAVQTPPPPVLQSTHAPTVSGPITIDWGSFVSQLLSHETPIIETVAQAGVSLVLHEIPLGSFIENFITPKVVKQYVDMALVAVQGGLEGQSIPLPSTGIAGNIAAVAENLFRQGEPELVSFLGGTIGTWITDAVGKLGLSPAT